MNKQACLRKALAAVLLWVSVLCLVGCETHPQETAAPEETSFAPEENSLWIFTSNSTMCGLRDRIVEDFQAKHPEVNVKVDTGPEEPEEWDAYMEQLRVQIMAGEGPDVYLLPSENTSSRSLVGDLNQFIRNGVLLDVSRYYDKDTELDKNGLSGMVMDAGTLDGGRYILPLRFNFPVLYADRQQLRESGIDPDVLSGDLSAIAGMVGTLGNGCVASTYSNLYFYLYWCNFIPQLIDYRTQNVTMEEADLVELMEAYQVLKDSGLSDRIDSLHNYIVDNNYWALEGRSFYLGTLHELAHNVIMADMLELDLAILPLTASDGSLVANVSVYGAVGAGTDHPELAYEFLREFLREENRWEFIRGDGNTSMTNGWPVLIDGAGDSLVEEYRWALRALKNITEEAGERRAAVKSVIAQNVSLESIFEDLYSQIDAVRIFPNSQFDLMQYMDSMLYPADGNARMELEDIAKEVIWDLQLHLAEG